MNTIKKIKKNKPKKKYTTAVILSGVFGIVGIHHLLI